MTWRNGPKTLLSAALWAGALAVGVGFAQPAAAQFRYDVEYPAVDYTRTPADNPVADLIARLESGETELEFSGNRGFLDSLLAELGIDPSSQVLVYSGTSLQYPLINAATPRALYFNDTTYIGWVRNSDNVEVATMDAKLGPVFYMFANAPDKPRRFLRETGRCLNCHDTQGMMGGGVPVLPVRSVMVDRGGAPFTYESGDMTTDSTPLSDRWGGWYVTGRHGDQVHLGNILVDGADELADLDAVRHGNLDTLDGLFDTGPYLRNTSDIVALMVLEHQVGVQNEITYVSFKAPAILERMGQAEAAAAATWDELPEEAKNVLSRMLDNLVQRMLFAGAITLDEPIQSSSGFDAPFENRGPRDAQGRSLRDLDLQTRLFVYPVSYEIYSEAFDNLPPYAKDYVYREIAKVLDGQGDSALYGGIADADLQAAREILLETKPDIAPYLGGSGQG